jgi:hypothetical protein
LLIDLILLFIPSTAPLESRNFVQGKMPSRWERIMPPLAMQLVMQRAVIHDHWQRMMNEVIRRWKQVAPVPARNRPSLR